MWVCVGLHLKPRHLLNLMCTSKILFKITNNEEYWTRVAAHLVFRSCDCMEAFHNIKEEYDILTPLSCNLYDMVGLDCGYYHGMNMFLARIEEMLVKYGEKDDYWCKYQTVDIKTKTLMLFNKDPVFSPWKSIGDEGSITMREFAQRIITSNSKTPAEMKMQAFVNTLDDSPVPAKIKGGIMNKLERLLWSLDAQVREENPFPSEIAFGICKF